MFSDKDFSNLFKQLRKKRYTIHQEIALYNAIRELSEKYKNKFFAWYLLYEKEYHKCLPEITNPKNEIEIDVQRFNETIKNPKEYNIEEISQFEKMICDYLAINLSRCQNGKNKNEYSHEYIEMELFLNRYEAYRPFYMVGFQIKYEEWNHH